MLTQIPTHVIAGPLGAGKTTLLRHLLETARPTGERWAILVNEFGQVGIDAALLQSDSEGVAIAEVAGGCLCCVNGVPFQVGLGRLLRRSKPDRVFIEASGLGHPLELTAQLSRSPWEGVLSVQPLLMVLDAQALKDGRSLPAAQADALAHAGLLLMNKSASMQTSDRQVVRDLMPPLTKLTWQDADTLDWSDIPRSEAGHRAEGSLAAIPEAPLPPGRLWRSKDSWYCQEDSHDGWYSIGWRTHPDLLFDPEALDEWLARHAWRRAKGMVHALEGWKSFNAVEGGLATWRSGHWKRDNRIELLYDQAPDRALLESGLRAAIAKV